MPIERIKQLLAQEENLQFLAAHQKQSISDLLFKYAKDPDKRLLIEQLAAHQQLAKKAPSWAFDFRKILPPSLNLQQSSSEATVQLKRAQLQPIQSFADLTGGLGIDFFGLAQGLDEAHYVEPDPHLVELAQHNASVWQQKATIWPCRAEEALAHLPEVDLIYLDPSRRNAQAQKTLHIADYLPRVDQLENALLRKARRVLIKVSPMYSIAEAQKTFQFLQEVWVISYRNDCKELLLYLRPQAGPIVLRTWNIEQHELQHYCTTWQNDGEALRHALPKKYLYEANASIMKAHLMDTCARDFGLHKLSTFSHLYTSDFIIRKWPGRIFEVKQSHAPFAKSLRKKRLSVISRNFPDKASQIEKKLALIPDKQRFLIATLSLEAYVFLECARLK